MYQKAWNISERLVYAVGWKMYKFCSLDDWHINFLLSFVYFSLLVICLLPSPLVLYCGFSLPQIYLISNHTKFLFIRESSHFDSFSHNLVPRQQIILLVLSILPVLLFLPVSILLVLLFLPVSILPVLLFLPVFSQFLWFTCDFLILQFKKFCVYRWQWVVLFIYGIFIRFFLH